MSQEITSLCQHRLWESYVEARDKAEKSRDINDGILAGRAWAAFVALFLEEK